jgi:hypothetical protein
MRSRRIVSGDNLTVSFLPTHLCVGASVHTVEIVAGRDKRGARQPVRVLRFIRLHIPFLFITISWRAR